MLRVRLEVSVALSDSTKRMSSRSFSRRLRTLEARLDAGPCADEKWVIIERHALQSMTETDRQSLKQAWALRDSGRTAEYTPDHLKAYAGWEDAHDRAFAESNVRFTIAEVDEMMVAT